MFTLDKLGIWGKIMLFFYLLIAANFIGNTFSCKIQSILKYNVYIRHFLAIITLYFVVLIVDNNFDKYSPFKMIFVCIVTYIYFLVSVKSHVYYFVISIILLIIISFLQHTKKHLKHTKKHLKHKENKNQNKYTLTKYIDSIQLLIIIIMICITLFGFFVYLGMKHEEYYKIFSISTFMLGKTYCKNNKFDKQTSNHYYYFLNGIKILTKSFS
jgi:hypothetical protein